MCWFCFGKQKESPLESWKQQHKKKHHPARYCVTRASFVTKKQRTAAAQPCFASQVANFYLASLEFKFSFLQTLVSILLSYLDPQIASTFHICYHQSLQRQLERAEAMKVHQSLIKKSIIPKTSELKAPSQTSRTFAKGNIVKIYIIQPFQII